MKTFLKKILVAIALVFTVSVASSTVTPTPVHADCRYVFGMTSWDCGLQEWNSEGNLKTNVVLIASNVLTDLTALATYLTIGFVIYGGYLYIFASGDVGKVANAKKTLTRAFIGLAIVVLSNVILNSIRIAFLGAGGSFTKDCTVGACVDEVAFVTNTINWFIGTAGAVAVIYVVIGGIGYVTSAGDAAKLQKSKNTILYALIGVAVAALSLAATAFVSNLVNKADGLSVIEDNNIIIAKESYEIYNY